MLGVGLPLMMLVAEGLHLRTGDPVWRALARGATGEALAGIPPAPLSARPSSAAASPGAKS